VSGARRTADKQRLVWEREIYSGKDRDYLIGFVELNKHSDFAKRIKRILKAYDKMNSERARAVVAFKKLNGTYK
jgi:hypothetical protein